MMFHGQPPLQSPWLYFVLPNGDVAYGHEVEDAVFENRTDKGPVEAHALLQLTFPASSSSAAVAFNQPPQQFLPSTPAPMQSLHRFSSFQKRLQSFRGLPRENTQAHCRRWQKRLRLQGVWTWTRRTMQR